jgi:hypothetical protein
VEAQRQLLVDGAVGVEENMCGVAVDTGESDHRDGHSRLLGDLADHRLGGGFADIDASSRQLPVAVIDPTDQEDLACDIAYGRERRGQHVVRAGRVRIPVILAQSHHTFSF